MSYKIIDESNIDSKYGDGRKRKKRKAIKTSIFARHTKDKDSKSNASSEGKNRKLVGISKSDSLRDGP